MTARIKKGIKWSAVLTGSGMLLSLLWWIFTVATIAAGAEKLATSHTPRIRAVEHRTLSLETRQSERHQVILRRFDRLEKVLDKP